MSFWIVICPPSRLLVGLLATSSFGCSRDKPAGAGPVPSVYAAPATSVISPSRSLQARVSAGLAQGPVPRASLDEASVMILIDSAIGGPDEMCLGYLAADVLERAGYSVWPSYNPCLDGRFIHLFPGVDPENGTIALHGSYVDDDIAVARAVSEPGLDAMPSQHDVQLLVADLLRSAAFRSRVGRVTASEGADQFVTSPVDPTQLEKLCRPWRSPAAKHR